MKQTPDGYIFMVRLSPKAARNQIGPWMKDADGQFRLRVSVTAVPEKGKANAALIGLLAKAWKIPKGQIVILRGETDRNKTLILNDIDNLPPQTPPLDPDT